MPSSIFKIQVQDPYEKMHCWTSTLVKKQPRNSILQESAKIKDTDCTFGFQP